MYSWWWAWWGPETCRVPEIKAKIIQLHPVGYIYTYWGSSELFSVSEIGNWKAVSCRLLLTLLQPVRSWFLKRIGWKLCKLFKVFERNRVATLVTVAPIYTSSCTVQSEGHSFMPLFQNRLQWVSFTIRLSTTERQSSLFAMQAKLSSAILRAAGDILSEVCC
jgi:hypothetical protein